MTSEDIQSKGSVSRRNRQRFIPFLLVSHRRLNRIIQVAFLCIAAACTSPEEPKQGLEASGECPLEINLLPDDQLTKQTETLAAIQADIEAAPTTEIGLTNGFEQALLSGDRRNFTLAVNKTGGFLVEIKQSGLDFSIAVTDPVGTLRVFDSPTQRSENKRIIFEATQVGNYSISLKSDDPTGAIGSLRLRIMPILASDYADRESLSALYAETSAMESFARGDESAMLKSQIKFCDAFEEWQRSGRRIEGAKSLIALATIKYWTENDYVASALLAQKAAELLSNQNESWYYSHAVYLQGLSLIELANFPELLEDWKPSALQSDCLTRIVAAEQPILSSDLTFDTVIKLFDESELQHRRSDRTYDIAHIENNRGLVAFYSADYSLAAKQWKSALAGFEGLSEWREAALVQQNLAVIDIDQGYLPSAINKLKYIIETIPRGKARDLQAIVLENLGAAFALNGNIDDALTSFTQSRDLYDEILESSAFETAEQRDEVRSGRARTARGIGTTYYIAGELDLATKHLNAALPIAKCVNDRRLVAAIETTRGNVAYLQRDFAAARRLHERAISLTRNSLTDHAHRRVLLAKDLNALGQHVFALGHAKAAHQLSLDAQSPVTTANALQEIAVGTAELGDFETATDHFNSALATFELLSLRSSQADLLHAISRAALNHGETALAISYGDSAIAMAEGLRSKVASPELRAFFTAVRRNYYETQSKLLMDMHFNDANGDEMHQRSALAISERGRARMMMDLLSQASINPSLHLQPELEERRDYLRDQLEAADYQLQQTSQAAIYDSTLASLRERQSQKADTLAHELNLINSEIARGNPKYAAMVNGSTLGASEIQSQIGSDATLLQYFLGEETSYVWAVSNDSLNGVELPGRQAIKGKVEKVFNRLKEPPHLDSGRKDLEEDLLSLSATILDPVTQFIDTETVLVAADGAIQYVPFAVLPISTESGRKRLIKAHNIVEIPSISVIGAQRSRSRQSSNSRLIALVADPVFEQTNNQSSGEGANLPATNDIITRSSVTNVGPTVGPNQLRRLRGTGLEAAQIAEFIPDHEKADSIFLRHRANRELLLKQDLRQFRILHFATHGIVDARYPALSSLALSQYDEFGNSQNGFLRLHDIYDLELNAALVVLSACETALGREVRGEGLVGLTQAFMYAGADSLLVSLWQVPDLATSELMKLFYSNMLGEGKMRPAAALARAQKTMAGHPKWGDPYFWGAFVLIGDWR